MHASRWGTAPFLPAGGIPAGQAAHNSQKTKGAADAKRSQAFTKIAREMIVAVKEGGSGDPNNNSRLATVIAKGKCPASTSVRPIACASKK